VASLIPRRDDPDDLRWGLLPFALYRGVASLILGHDPVVERQRQRLAKESHEDYERLSHTEHEVYEQLHQRHLRRADEPDAATGHAPEAQAEGSDERS
jgi:hypothetical protein